MQPTKIDALYVIIISILMLCALLVVVSITAVIVDTSVELIRSQ